jgi:hypothetical protein
LYATQPQLSRLGGIQAGLAREGVTVFAAEQQRIDSPERVAIESSGAPTENGRGRPDAPTEQQLTDSRMTTGAWRRFPMERTLTKGAVVNLGGEITPARAEEVIAQLADTEEGTPVSVRFSGYPYMTPGTGWRIGNALRRFSNDSLEARVPLFGEGDWFRTFTRSGLGYALAAHAGRILSDGTDITAQVRDFYNGREKRSDQNAVFFGELHRGLGVNPDREDLFRDVFLASLKKVNVRPTNFHPDRIQDIIKFAFEGIQNIYDHAARKPLPHKARIVSYFLLGYYKSIKGHPDPTGRLRGYDERLVALTGRRRTDFLQVCVNDDGVGIAARQAQNLEIYRGALDDEEVSLRNALRANSSVKLRAQDCRVRGVSGVGYTHIESCLRILRALAVLRTGRLLTCLDGTDESGTGFDLLTGTLGYMPGTTLDVLIPILKEGDGQPSLFGDE